MLQSRVSNKEVRHEELILGQTKDLTRPSAILIGQRKVLLTRDRDN
jgi:hypothetical protein